MGGRQTSNGRLPVKIRFPRAQTLANTVSDNPRHFIFGRPEICCPDFLGPEICLEWILVILLWMHLLSAQYDPCGSFFDEDAPS